jgi:hypothetical protein
VSGWHATWIFTGVSCPPAVPWTPGLFTRMLLNFRGQPYPAYDLAGSTIGLTGTIPLSEVLQPRLMPAAIGNPPGTLLQYYGQIEAV